MFNVSFVGRDPILCPFYGFWLKPKAEHFSGEDSPWKASWEKCGEKLATLSFPFFLTACSSFPQTDNTHNLPKEAGLQIDQSQNCATAAAAAVALSLPSPHTFFASLFTARLHYYLLNRALKIITCSKQWKGALKENK